MHQPSGLRDCCPGLLLSVELLTPVPTPFNLTNANHPETRMSSTSAIGNPVHHYMVTGSGMRCCSTVTHSSGDLHSWVVYEFRVQSSTEQQCLQPKALVLKEAAHSLTLNVKQCSQQTPRRRRLLTLELKEAAHSLTGVLTSFAYPSMASVTEDLITPSGACALKAPHHSSVSVIS